MWMQDCYKKGIPIDSNMIVKKQSPYITKHKEGEGSKTGAFNVNKGWFDNFRKSFGFKTVNVRE